MKKWLNKEQKLLSIWEQLLTFQRLYAFRIEIRIVSKNLRLQNETRCETNYKNDCTWV